MIKVLWRTIAVVLWTILTFIAGIGVGAGFMMWVDGTDEKSHEYNKHIFRDRSKK